MKTKVLFLTFLLFIFLFSAPTYSQQPLNTSPTNINPVNPITQETIDANSQPQKAPFLKGKIVSLSGEVRLRKTKSITWERAKVNDEVFTGYQIKTARNGQVKIEIENGNIVYLKPNSVIVLTELTQDELTGKYNNIFTTDKGKIKAEVNDTQKMLKFEVRTPTAVAGVRGCIIFLNVVPEITQFFVQGGSGFMENTISGKTQDIGDGLFSSSDNTGNITPPAPPTPEQKQEFEENWEPAQTPPATTTEGASEEIQNEQENQEEAQNDAQNDRKTSQEADKGDYKDNPPPPPPAPAPVVEVEVDTDSDGIVDRLDVDDDNDGLSDTFETGHGLDPKRADSDGDGLNDYLETIAIASYNYSSDIAWNAKHTDSNGDGIDDRTAALLGADPSIPDSDHDGVPDAVEIAEGTDPASSYSFPSGLTYNMDLDNETDALSYDIDGDELDNTSELHLGTDPRKIDTDGDGLSDHYEAYFNSDPRVADTDADGFSDGVEYQNSTNPRDGANSPGYVPPDADHDGLADNFEIAWGSNPNLADSDADGLNDNAELQMGTNPNNPDSDGDGLTDGQEEYTYYSDALKADSDGDGAPDNIEVANSTLPDYPTCFPYVDDGHGHNVYDYDGDGIPDAYDSDDDNDGINDAIEAQLGTDPRNPDTDGDGFTDGRELNLGLNPLVADAEQALSVQGAANTITDSDGDDLPDYIERQIGTNPNIADTDGDGLTDGFEADFGEGEGKISPLLADTDGDGLTDGEEVLTYHTCPYAADEDGDGLNDAEEVAHWTQATHRDTDRDGLADGPEVWQGSDPLSGDSDGDGAAHFPTDAIKAANDDCYDAFPNAVDNSNNPAVYGSRASIRSRRYTELANISGLRQEIRDMLTDIFARERDYLMDKISDAQMHKVMTDKNGYRVRVEEYVFRPTSDKVSVLNICLRTQEAGALSGLTVLDWTTQFNASLNNLSSDELKALPWDEYLAAAPSYGTSQPAYHPTNMYVRLENPSADSIKQIRQYSSIFQSEGSWYQNIISNQISINGGAPQNYSLTTLSPTSFRYTAADENSVDFSISVIDETGMAVPGSFDFYDLWEVIAANLMGSDELNYVGDNFVEIEASSTSFAYNIDSVYIPVPNLRWKHDFSWRGAQ
jgi:hypothetical protein